jgi:hypothetical protein
MLDYTDGPTMGDYGYIHEDSLPDLDNMQDHLQGVVEAFYKTGDIAAIENGLDELCHALGVELTPNAQPAVEKRKLRGLMLWHIDNQKQIMDFMKRNRLSEKDYENYTKDIHHA